MKKGLFSRIKLLAGVAIIAGITIASTVITTAAVAMKAAAAQKNNEYSVTWYYNIAFEKNAEKATGEMDTITKVKPNIDVTLPENEFEYYGYKFMGWNLSPDGSGLSLKDKDIVNNKILGVKEHDETITLYAQWEPDMYTVKYDPNTGTGHMDDQEIEWLDETTQVSPNLFTKPNHIFLGWSLDPAGPVQFQSGSIHRTNLKDGIERYGVEPGGIVTLYAIWEPGKISDGYYKIKGKSTKGGPSHFYHSEIIGGNENIIVNNTENDEKNQGTPGEEYAGIYYFGDEVEFEKKAESGNVGGTYKYPGN